MYLRYLQFFSIEVVHIVPSLGSDNKNPLPLGSKILYTKKNVSTVRFTPVAFFTPQNKQILGFWLTFSGIACTCHMMLRDIVRATRHRHLSLSPQAEVNKLCSRKYVKILLRPF